MGNLKSIRVIALCSVTALLAMTSCKDTPAEQEKEVIVMPGNTTVIEKETTVVDSSQGTSVRMDKDGVQVESDKLDVQVGK